MTRATPTWTNTVIEDWEAGDIVTAANILQQILQNLEWFAQEHSHSEPNGGAFLPTADPKAVWFYGRG